MIRSMLAAGVDEHGTSLQPARDSCELRTLDLALYEAVGAGSVQAVEMLLDAGANMQPDHPDYESTALLHACYYGQADVAAFLIERGADVHADNEYALRRAVMHDKIDVVAVLIQHGADARVGNPLQSCTRDDIRALLIQHGARPS